MQDAPKAMNCLVGLRCARAFPRALAIRCALILCAMPITALVLDAQTAPTLAPAKAPVRAAAATMPPAQPDQGPVFATPPVAIVPLDPSMPGAALEVEGPMQAWNGQAYLTGSGSITAGAATAEVSLPSRGTLRVCASSTVKLAEDAHAPAGEVPGLLLALDRGAVEMSLAPSKARAKNADTLLTPYFRILIGGPNAADVKVRLGEHGDTCVDNPGADAPYVLVTSVFDGGFYRVQPGQRAMFENGSLQAVVDRENEPCGCPPPLAAVHGNEFPLAESEGLVPGKQAPVISAAPSQSGPAAATLSYSGAERKARIAAPVMIAPVASRAPAAAPTASAKPAAKKKPGIFARVGHFLRRIFGTE